MRKLSSLILVMCIFGCGTNRVSDIKYEAPDKTYVGPIPGHATSKTISIWFYTAPNSIVDIHYLEKSGSRSYVAAFKPIEITAKSLKEKGQPYKVVISNLKNNTSYRYRVTVDGKSEDTLTGEFKTAPQKNKAAKFRLALTSCFTSRSNSQKSWSLLHQEKPDLHLTLGDTQYSNSTQPDRQWPAHLKMRALPELAEAFRNRPNYSIWDDHDYGPNNSDGTATGKEDSLKTWKQLWCNPKMGTADIHGAFYKFSWADVDFFVVDSRYHRSPNKATNDETKTMLGKAQHEWLVDSLKKSKATFKVIASGSTWQHNKKDCWSLYSHSQEKLLKAIDHNKISGVLYLSGDIHQCTTTEHKPPHMSYPFVELISSGISNSKGKAFMIIEFNTLLKDPTFKATIISGGDKGIKKIDSEKTWKLSQLQIK